MKKLKLYFTFCLLLSRFMIFGQPTSEYQPELLDARTLEFIDSTLKSNHPHNGVFIAYGLSGKPAEQYTYWNKHRTKIPKDDFLILKNHTSPIIRYYAYQEILSKNSRDSKYDFILHHLQDIEIVRLSSGCVFQQKPVILYFIETHLNFFEKEKISQQILLTPTSTPYHQLNKFAIDHWDFNEEKYNIIKTSAKEGNNNALNALIRFRKQEDEKFILENLTTLLSSKETRNSAFLILQQARLYDFPSNVLEVLVDYHNHAKQNKELNHVIENFPELYNSIVRYNHPKTFIILEEVLLHTQKPRKVLSFSNRSKSNELLELQLKIWDEYNIIHRSTFEKLREAFPEKIYPLAKRDLDAMINDEKQSTFCFEKFLYVLIRREESIEKYINWALQSKKNDGLSTIALKNLPNHLFLSSKKHVITMLSSADKIYTCRDILMVLSKYKLKRSDKKQVKQWYLKTGKNIEYDKKVRQFDIEACLNKMGVKT